MESVQRLSGSGSRRDELRHRRPGRFASVVVEELADLIVSGTYREGDVLPTEPALCEEFGFSRTVVREALKLLEERGLLRVEQGRGTRVQPRSSWDLLDPAVLQIALAYDDDMTLLDDLISVRRVLEREMAREAATTPHGRRAGRARSDRRRDGDVVRRLRPLPRPRQRVPRDHHASLRQRDRAHDRPGHPPPRRRYGSARLGRPREGAQAHRLPSTAQILEALAARDGELAGERISAHIEARWAERKKRGAAAGS